MDYDKTISEFCQDRIKPGIKKLINLTNSDLYFGPLIIWEEEDGTPHYLKFVTACKIIKDYLEMVLPKHLYIEDWCGIPEEKEPEGWGDEDTGEWHNPGPYYKFDYQDIVRALVGVELMHYVG